MGKFGKSVQGQARVRLRHGTRRGSSQFFVFVIYKLQQLKAERGRCHLAKDSSQNFPQRSFGSLHEGQKQLRPLRTTLDEGALQWQRRHLQSGFSHPRQYFLGRLRTCGPAQPAEGCKSHFEMTIPQGFSQRMNSFRGARSAERHERSHAPPALQVLRLEDAFLDEPARTHEFQQARGFLRPRSFEGI